MKRLATVLVGTAALALAATPASAAPAQHLHLDEQFDGTEHWAAEDNSCGPWAATFHEVRSGGYDLLAAPGGQQPGEVHVNGAVSGHVDLVPDDPSLPSYSGSYREKVNGVFVGTDPATGEDVTRVSTFRLRLPLAGSDGSRLVLVLSGKVTLKPSGEAVVTRSRETCS